jgi:hypothetical protein
MKTDAATAQSQLLAASLLRPQQAAETVAPKLGAEGTETAKPAETVAPAEGGRPAGRAAHPLLAALPTDRPPTAGDRQQQDRQMLQETADRLEAAFAGAEIAADQPLVLSIQPDGTVEVVNSHPDALRIEQLFADQPALGQALRAAEAARRRLDRSGSGDWKPGDVQDEVHRPKFRDKLEIHHKEDLLGRTGDDGMEEASAAPAAPAAGNAPAAAPVMLTPG